MLMALSTKWKLQSERKERLVLYDLQNKSMYMHYTKKKGLEKHQTAHPPLLPPAKQILKVNPLGKYGLFSYLAVRCVIKGFTVGAFISVKLIYIASLTSKNITRFFT